jgi:outer membrane protein OmpA-like peptidoglycan-associated protein
MKRYITIVVAVIFVTGARGQERLTAALKNKLLKDEHYCGLLQSDNNSSEPQVIMWYPNEKEYRPCNVMQRLQPEPAGYHYVASSCQCDEDFKHNIAAASPESYSNIQFEFDSSLLKTSSYPELDVTSADLKSSGATVELDGHASSEGDATHNMRLSKDRAISVKTYLVNSGVPADRIKIKAFGETHPIADNSTEAGRILNRRVEFKKK